MSATIVIARSDAIWLATDGAAVIPDGRVCGYTTKQFPIAHLPAVVALQGNVWIAMRLVSDTMLPFADFDAMVDGIERQVRQAHQVLVNEWAHLPNLPAEVSHDGIHDFIMTIAGWSAARGPEAYAIANASSTGLPPFELRKLPAIAFTPMNEAGAAYLGLPESLPDLMAMDVGKAAIRIMEGQRRVKGKQSEAAPEFTPVGMFCQLTKLSAAGIVTRVIHRWPDKVGEVINPDAGAAA